MAPPVTFLQLFRYASAEDLILIGVANVFILYSSLNIPLVNIIYGLMMREMNDYVARRAALGGSQPISSSGSMGSDSAPANGSMAYNGTLEEAQELFMDNSYNLCMLVIVFGITRFVALYLALLFFSWAAANQAKRVKLLFFKSLLRQEVAWFERNRTGDFAIRITTDLSKFEEGIGEKIALCLNALFAWMSSLISSFYYGWELTLVCLVLVPLTIITTTVIAEFQATYSIRESSALSGAFNVCHEVLSSIRTVLAFSGQRKEAQRFRSALEQAYKFGLRRNMFAALNLGFTWMSGYLGFAICLLYSTKFYRPEYAGHYDEARIITILWSAAGCVFLLNRMMPFIEIIQMARGSAANLFAVIERKSLIDVSSPEGLTPRHLEANVEFANVSFTYPSSAGESVDRHVGSTGTPIPLLEDGDEEAEGQLQLDDRCTLRKLSLQVSAGQTIALVGPSGSGKSTALALLQRFYELDEGTITLGGHNLRHLNLAWLRAQFGVVTQEPVLFDISIADNIRLGALPGQSVTDQEVEQAARMANAHAFIQRLPQGYETRAGTRGLQLSGGQKQRIAIARALVRQPKILLLDEATSALDLESESVVQKALDQARVGRTTFIVAHRLSTVRNADLILVLDRGQVVEQGNHEQLLQQRGLYHQISVQQQRGLDLQSMGPPAAHLGGRRSSQIGCGLLALPGRADPAPLQSDHHLHGQYTRESRSLSITGKYAATQAAGGFSAAGHGGNGEGVDNGGSCCTGRPDAGTSEAQRFATDDDLYGNRDEDDEASDDTIGQELAAGQQPAEAIMPPRILVHRYAEQTADTQASTLLESELPQSVTYGEGRGGVGRAGLSSQLAGWLGGGRSRAKLSVLRVLAFIRPNVPCSLVGVFTSLLMGLCIPISAMIIGDIATIFSTDQKDDIRQGLYSHGLLYVGLAVFAFCVSFVQVLSLGIAGERIGLRLRQLGFEAVMGRQLSWFDRKRNNPGSICARLASDVGNVQSITGNRTAVIFQSISILVSTLVFAIYFNLKYSSICATFVAILLISTVMQSRYAGKLNVANRNFDSQIGKIVLESSANIRTLVSLHQEAYFIDKCEQLLEKDRRSKSLDNHLRLSLESLKYAMTAISKGSSFYFAARMLRDDEITIDVIFKLIEIILYGLTEASKSLIFISDLEKARRGTENLYKLIQGTSAELSTQTSGGGGMASSNLAQISLTAGPAKGKKGGLARLASLLNTAPAYERLNESIQEEASDELANEAAHSQRVDAGGQPAHCKGRLQFQGVRFHYPTRAEVCVLKSFSADIAAGKSVALVGRSGCGKSTIVQLLERFYDYAGGQILLDDCELRRLPLDWVRRQIALVSQEPSLLSYSIGDNIRYGDNSRHVSQQEVEEAARVANIHEFISSLPDGYDTQLSDSTSLQLSGGQKQRIAIARALIRRAPIMVFDEATSALDTKSELRVQEALDRAREGRTSIIIAHRLSTIKSADRILVLRDGLVVEQGSHEELIEQRGEYYTLHKTQSRL